MNPMEMNKPQTHSEQTAYICEGLLIVPHYDKCGFFVAPGHSKEDPRVFHEAQLRRMKATSVKLQLWPRDYK